MDPYVSLHKFGDPVMGQHYYLSLSPGFPVDELDEWGQLAVEKALECAFVTEEDAAQVSSHLMGLVG